MYITRYVYPSFTSTEMSNEEITPYTIKFTELSIERVTEIDSSVSKQNIDDKDTEANTIFFKQDENIETKKWMNCW